jgi:holo-[acyl-carrier protein] synthase
MDQFGDRYLNRVYTRGEIESAGHPGLRAGSSTSASRAPHFAARFAAKEAAFKALHAGDATSGGDARDQPFDWRTIEVLRRPDGSPALCLHGSMRGLAERRGVRHLDVSLSHDGDYAIAVVVGEARGSRRSASAHDRRHS